MPDEKVAPKRTPKEATSITTLSGAMREPTAEFKKFTAEEDPIGLNVVSIARGLNLSRLLTCDKDLHQKIK